MDTSLIQLIELNTQERLAVYHWNDRIQAVYHWNDRIQAGIDIDDRMN